MYISANVYIHKIPDNIAVVEGEKLQLHCKVYGSEPISITWKIGEFDGVQKSNIFDENDHFHFFPNFAGGTEAFNRSHVILKPDEDNNEDAILIIENAVLEDRHSYNCSATNPASQFNSTLYPAAQEGTYIRVKGMLSPNLSWQISMIIMLLNDDSYVSLFPSFLLNRQTSCSVAVLGNLRGSVYFMCHHLSI